MKPTRQTPARTALGLEPLEGRDLMAAALTATLTGSVLRVEGTAGADQIRVTRTAEQIAVEGVSIRIGGQSTVSVSAAAVQRVDLVPLGGDDVIRLGDAGQRLGRVTEWVPGGGADLIFVDGVHQPAAGAADVRKVAVAPNGSVYSLSADGWLSVNGSRVWANTADFALAADGTLYYLHTLSASNGWFGRLTASGWQQLSSTVTKIRLADGMVVWTEGSAGRLYEMPVAGDYRQVSSTVSTFEVAGGKIVWLEGGSAGRLYEQPLGGSYRQIGSFVQSFTLSPAGPPQVTYTLIGQKYASLGPAYRSVLGAPITPEQDVYWVSGARSAYFETGAIFWSTGTGAHVVQGGIWQKYHDTPGLAGALGLPTTDEFAGSGDSRINYFQNGAIYWTPAGGGHAVHGAVWRQYALTGGGPGPLGLPTSDLKQAEGFTWQEFQAGVIIQTSDGVSVLTDHEFMAALARESAEVIASGIDLSGALDAAAVRTGLNNKPFANNDGLLGRWLGNWTTQDLIVREEPAGARSGLARNDR